MSQKSVVQIVITCFMIGEVVAMITQYSITEDDISEGLEFLYLTVKVVM